MAYPDDYDDEPSARSAPSEAMKFEVRLTEYNMDGMAQDIARQLADRVLRDQSKSIKDMARAILTERVNQELEAAIAPIVSDALGQPLIPTDAFGRAKGEPTTARDMIAKGAEEFLQATVDYDGKPKPKDNYGSGQTTRMSWLLRSLIDKKFSDEITAAVEKMKRDIQREMQAAAAAWLAEFQAKARSAMDKAKA